MLVLLVFFAIFCQFSYINTLSLQNLDCNNLICDAQKPVCGIRSDGEGFRLKMFQNQCELMKHGCKVEDKLAYRIVNMFYCDHSFKINKPPQTNKQCIEFDCSYPTDAKEVCGIRQDGEGFRVRIFKNKCQLWKYNCENDLKFSITDNFICYNSVNVTKSTTENSDFNSEKESFTTEDSRRFTLQNFESFTTENPENVMSENPIDFTTENYGTFTTETSESLNMDTSETSTTEASDGFITEASDGFTTEAPESFTTDTLERFITEPSETFTTETSESFTTETSPSFSTDDKIFTTENNERFSTYATTTTEANALKTESRSRLKNIIIVDNMINFNNINESIDNFFAATHVFDLPIRDVGGEINETTRRMLVGNAGPIKVFKPWITKPKNVSEDFYHTPTLSSCFHKCPSVCPQTYAPVCGVPGNVAREPSLMFQNHCFMDVAQCKMYWEDKSPTATSSNYIESSFLFCLGDELNGLYRFLPLIRTLQHMGRLKKKGRFRYKMKNMRFFNNLLAREPNLMG